MSLSAVIESIEREMFDRATREENIKCCQNCKYYNLREEIKDERGKHECYGYSMICSPICLGYEIEKENNCQKFKEKDGTSAEEIEKEWWSKPFMEDKSTDLLVSAMLKRGNKNGGT